MATTVYRTKSGKFTLRHTAGASVAGAYETREFDGVVTQSYTPAACWTDNPQPSDKWLNAHEPRFS